jgi:predicted nucleic acid-binding protein
VRRTLVIDASVAIKWVVTEVGTPAALALRAQYYILAPELWLAECANILWKKSRRGELSRGEAEFAAKLLERSGVELATMRGLAEEATRLAIEIDHPAYDCLYLALAATRNAQFVTADRRLVAKVRAFPSLTARCIELDAFAPAP